MTQIGRYEIVRQTGQTPLGTIYEAIDSTTRRTVSIQATARSSGEFSPTRSRAQTAVQESGESLGRLSHPNIRNLIAMEQKDGRLFLVMEHMEAKPLLQYAAERQASPEERLKLLKCAAEALDYAHQNGVFHPGLTPNHLLVNASGFLKIAGFEMPGFEAFLETAGDAEVEDLQNSVPYRSPEFLCGEARDGRADQFSLAAIGYELFTGRRLYSSLSPIQLMAAIVSGEKPDLSVLDSKTSVVFRRALERALAPQSDGRYTGCTPMADAMRNALNRPEAKRTKFVEPPPLPEAIPTRPNRMRWIMAAMVLVTIVIMVLIVSLARNPKQRVIVTPPPSSAAGPVPVPTQAPVGETPKTDDEASKPTVVAKPKSHKPKAPAMPEFRTKSPDPE